MKLFIKNMVSLRCRMVVKSEVEKLGLTYSELDLGEINLTKDISDEQRASLKTALLKAGLVLMDDKKSMIIEKIKNVVIEMVHYTDETPTKNFSDHLSSKLLMDYNYLSNLFTEVKGTTIEQYIILHKIERVKELLIYDEMNLTQIAEKLHYSSVAHLSNQFKKVTGLTPTHFKKMKQKRFRNLEDL